MSYAWRLSVGEDTQDLFLPVNWVQDILKMFYFLKFIVYGHLDDTFVFCSQQPTCIIVMLSSKLRKHLTLNNL